MSTYSDKYVESLERQIEKHKNQKVLDEKYIAALQTQCRLADECITEAKKIIADKEYVIDSLVAELSARDSELRTAV